MSRLLNALSIRHVGARVATILANEFGSMDALAAASVEQLSEVDEIGETIAQSVYGYLHDPWGAAIIQRLREVGVAMQSVDSPKAGNTGPLAGKTLVVTGTMVNRTRDEMEALIAAHGGRAASSVSTKTDYVVAGEKAGSKLAKAKKLGVPVISEDDFEKLLSAAGE
jgi:DNA ligase (NAD+)